MGTDYDEPNKEGLKSQENKFNKNKQRLLNRLDKRYNNSNTAIENQVRLLKDKIAQIDEEIAVLNKYKNSSGLTKRGFKLLSLLTGSEDAELSADSAKYNEKKYSNKINYLERNKKNLNKKIERLSKKQKALKENYSTNQSSINSSVFDRNKVISDSIKFQKRDNTIWRLGLIAAIGVGITAYFRPSNISKSVESDLLKKDYNNPNLKKNDPENYVLKEKSRVEKPVKKYKEPKDIKRNSYLEYSAFFEDEKLEYKDNVVSGREKIADNFFRQKYKTSGSNKSLTLDEYFYKKSIDELPRGWSKNLFTKKEESFILGATAISIESEFRSSKLKAYLEGVYEVKNAFSDISQYDKSFAKYLKNDSKKYNKLLNDKYFELVNSKDKSLSSNEELQGDKIGISRSEYQKYGMEKPINELANEASKGKTSIPNNYVKDLISKSKGSAVEVGQNIS